MKSIKKLKVHEIEKKALASIAGGLVKEGSHGSWSWGAGTYTNDCDVYFNNLYCATDYTGTISYDGRKLQGICVQLDNGEFDSLERYAFDTN